MHERNRAGGSAGSAGFYITNGLSAAACCSKGAGMMSPGGLAVDIQDRHLSNSKSPDVDSRKRASRDATSRLGSDAAGHILPLLRDADALVRVVHALGMWLMVTPFRLFKKQEQVPTPTFAFTMMKRLRQFRSRIEFGFSKTVRRTRRFSRKRVGKGGTPPPSHTNPSAPALR